MATQGGPASNVVVVADGRPRMGGPALPVAVVTDGRATEADFAEPVYVVTSGPVQAGPAQPIVAAPAGASVKAGPAQPVFVVQGSLGGADPMAYTNKVKALSPIGYWPMAEASGTTIVDASGNGRNGVYKAAGEPLLGQVGIGDGRPCPLFDGVNDFGNVFSASLQAAFNGAEGTLAIWFKVANAGVWTDATARRLASFRVDSNNRVQLDKSATNNVVAATYVAGGTSKGINFTTAGPLTWLHLLCTWSKSADQFMFYVAGAQVGATQTGLGTWVGSLGSTVTILGASDNVGSTPSSGYEAHAAVWPSALSASTVATLAVVP